jgi:putative transposase
VLDVFSRRIVGWSMSTRLEARLVLAALDMALAMRKPQGVIQPFRPEIAIHLARLRPALPGDGRPPLDGLCGRRLRQRHGAELLRHTGMRVDRRSRFGTQAEARLAVFDFIEGLYNRLRRHSALVYLAPNDFERQHANSTASPGAS